MVYSLCIYPLGEVTLLLDSTVIRGFYTYMQGRDRNSNIIHFKFDRFKYLRNGSCDFGYCRIVSYTMRGVTTSCNIYRALY